MQNKITRWVYIIVVLLLFLPIIQSITKVVEVGPLQGTYREESVKIPTLSLPSLRDESFQTAANKSWKQKLGFKNWFVRLNNQINYSLFNKSNANGTIVCEDNYQITEAEIKAFLGEDFIGEARLRELWEKVEYVQDSLEKRGILFFIMITPGKASTYSDKIPKKYFDLYDSPQTNYESFIAEAKSRGVKLFDAKAIINNDKSYFDHPVFPKNGIHWSGNTVAKISDTLVDFISKEANVETPDILLKEGEKTVLNYRYTDYDIGEAMNLMWNISDDILHYPNMTFADIPSEKVNALGVGDSFIQSFFGFYPVLDSVFSKESNIWYYNEIMGWPHKYEGKSIPVKKLDLSREVLSRQVVFLEMTEENLKLAAYGFIDDLYEELKGKNQINNEQKPLLNDLMNSPEIIDEAKKLAPIVGYSLDEMKKSIAAHKLKNDWLIDFDYEAEVERIIQIIKNDKKWLASVKEKSIRRNQTLEKTIRDDAVWTVNKKMKR